MRKNQSNKNEVEDKKISLYNTFIDTVRLKAAAILLKLYFDDENIDEDKINDANDNNYLGFFPYNFIYNEKKYRACIKLDHCKEEEININFYLSLGADSTRGNPGKNIVKYIVNNAGDKVNIGINKQALKSYPKIDNLEDVIKIYNNAINLPLYKYLNYNNLTAQNKNSDESKKLEEAYLNKKNEWVIDSLKNRTAHFSNPKQLNDLYDGTNCLFSLYSYALISDKFKKEELTDIFEEIKNLNESRNLDVFDKEKVFEEIQNHFNLKAPAISKKLDDIKEGYLNNFFAYILSLTSHPDNTLMWSHYGNSNNGVCLEYPIDMLKNFTLNQEQQNPSGKCYAVLTRVNYTKKTPKVTYISYLNYFVTKKIAFLITELMQLSFKNDVWAYEDEYRIIFIRDKNIEEKPFCGNICGFKPSKIICGANWNNENLKDFLSKFEPSELTMPINKIQIDKNEYNIKLEPFNL